MQLKVTAFRISLLFASPSSIYRNEGLKVQPKFDIVFPFRQPLLMRKDCCILILFHLKHLIGRWSWTCIISNQIERRDHYKIVFLIGNVSIFVQVRKICFLCEKKEYIKVLFLAAMVSQSFSFQNFLKNKFKENLREKITEDFIHFNIFNQKIVAFFTFRVVFFLLLIPCTPSLSIVLFSILPLLFSDYK